jgi:hypothetical protein
MNIAEHNVSSGLGGNMGAVLAEDFGSQANGNAILVDGGAPCGKKILHTNFDRIKSSRGPKYWNAAEPGKPHDPGTPEMAERNLWLGVLEAAIIDLQSEEHRQGALRWFTSRRDGIGSCRWVCEQLGFDFEAMRKRIDARSNFA